MGRLFGTDGARGVANKELTVSLATAIGKQLPKFWQVSIKNQRF